MPTGGQHRKRHRTTLRPEITMTDLENDASQGVPDGEPVAQPDTSAPDTGQEQSQDNREAAAQPAEGQEPNEQARPNPPWFVTRLEKQRQEIERRDRRIAELEHRAQPQNAEGDADRPLTQADIDRLANERAVQIDAGRQFATQCNTVFDQGVKTYQDFEASLQNFRHLGGLTQPFLEAALETGEASRVLYELGKNPDEAARILALSPTRMAVAVARLAAKPATPPPVSKAPPPIKPIANGQVETDPDPSDVAAWMKARAKQVAH